MYRPVTCCVVVFLFPALLHAQYVIDFDAPPPGTIVDTISVPNLGDVAVFGERLDQPGVNHAVLFDTANPTGGDIDLGSPNETCGGPGVSLDGVGEIGGSHPNCLLPNGPLTAPLYNVLIIASDLVDSGGDGLVDDPDDFNGPGILTLSFPEAVTVYGLTLLDCQSEEFEHARLRLFANDDGTGELFMSPIVLPPTGDNGLEHYEVPFADTYFNAVRSMAVEIEGSAAIDNVVIGFCGDGVIGPDESCDGAARRDCFGPCRDDCTCCGDDVVNDEEQCDGEDLGSCEEICVDYMIDFEEFVAGEIVEDITWIPDLTVAVYGARPDRPSLNHAIVFDTWLINPEPGIPGSFIDVDLGSPNETCGGPGVSLDGAGEIGGAAPNCLVPDGPLVEPLANILIVADNLVGAAGDGIVDLPNDFNGLSHLSLAFSRPVTLTTLTYMDVQAEEEETAVLRLFADPAGAVLVADMVLAPTGDNGVAVLDLWELADIRLLEFHTTGSAAIDNIGVVVCHDPTCREDCICATCGNGLIDEGEMCDGDDTGECRDGCTDVCTCAVLEPMCGNGIREPGESCDGDDMGNCHGDCRDDCTCCGDSIINGGEICDGVSGGCITGCSMMCNCNQEPVLCGNGVLEFWEECDGTLMGACEGVCSDLCQCIELPACGNGVLDPGETCDGIELGDCAFGCTPDCTCEPVACCLPDGECAVLGPVACSAAGGQPQGTSGDCTGIMCPVAQTAGACCLGNECVAGVTEADCAGTWLGVGTTCADAPCHEPSGACCLPRGCYDMIQQCECDRMRGIFMGESSKCMDVSCGPQ